MLAPHSITSGDGCLANFKKDLGHSVMSSAAHDNPVLEVRKLVKSFIGGRQVAVNDLSLEVYPGEIVSILGPSGCGKTTTLRIIAGLEEADGGDVLIEGRSVLGLPPHKRNIGLVFQDLALFPHKTVSENVSFGLRMKGIPVAERSAQVERMFRLVELPVEEFGDRMPAMLSGGQRQRVALARTLVVQPAIVLFDEPMSGLDRRLRDRMASELRRIQKHLGVASIYVTHDQDTASMMSDRIIVMESGRIMQVGTPLEVYQYPRSRFVANFIGDMNFLAARIIASNESRTTIEVCGTQFELPVGSEPVGTEASLAIRPEELRLSSTRTNWCIAEGKLASRHFVSGIFLYLIALNDGSDVMVRSYQGELAVEGEGVWIEADPESCRILRD